VTEKTEKMLGNKCLLAIRIRGTVSAKREARETLDMLHLIRNNYAVLVDDRPSFVGMLQAARNYITWGEISKEAVTELMQKRARLAGNRKIPDEYIQKTGNKSMAELAEKIFNRELEYWHLPNIQTVFKLRPPTKGYKGNIKKGYGAGGEAGYRGDKINELIKRMI
jgi:large subunit ribosomal protein L30